MRGEERNARETRTKFFAKKPQIKSKIAKEEIHKNNDQTNHPEIDPLTGNTR